MVMEKPKSQLTEQQKAELEKAKKKKEKQISSGKIITKQNER